MPDARLQRTREAYQPFRICDGHAFHTFSYDVVTADFVCGRCALHTTYDGYRALLRGDADAFARESEPPWHQAIHAH